MQKVTSNPLYSRFVIFRGGLAGIHVHKAKLVLNMPLYVGITILDNSKILMYDFYYNVLGERNGRKYELIYTDTNLLIEVEMENIYKDMEKDVDLCEMSDFPKKHFLHSKKKKSVKVIGKMKDECSRTLISQ